MFSVFTKRSIRPEISDRGHKVIRKTLLRYTVDTLLSNQRRREESPPGGFYEESMLKVIL